jgi:ABC-type uncharacterized transport system substrate-binding protein
MRTGALALLSVILWVAPAGAHPHIWIDALATLQFSEGRLVGVKLDWIFDKLFSAGLIADFDRDRNKQLDAGEIETLRKDAFVELGALGYFTHLWVGEEKLKIEAVQDFSAVIVQGRVAYRFIVPLASPVDVLATPVALGLYDESFYVEVAPVPDQPFRFSGVGEGSCRVEAEKLGGDAAASLPSGTGRRQRLVCKAP